MDFRLKGGEALRTVRCLIASATVIEPGDMVTLDTGLIVKADETSVNIAWCEQGSADGETVCEVSVGNDFTLLGTTDANFAVTDKGLEVDMVIATGVQLIDLGASSTDVFKVAISETAGTVGSTSDVEVRINKPLF